MDNVVNLQAVCNEGHSINKLQNYIILLVFRLWKFWNIRFVGDLILSTSCEFYCDDVTVTSVINIRYGNVAADIILQGTAFCYCCEQKDLAQMPFSLSASSIW